MSNVMVEQRICALPNCNEPIVRHVYSNGETESRGRFQSRRFCSAPHASRANLSKGYAATAAKGAVHREYIASELEFLMDTDTPASLASRLGYFSIHTLLKYLDRCHETYGDERFHTLATALRKRHYGLIDPDGEQ